MKKIISLFVFVFTISDLCYSQATLLENSTHYNGGRWLNIYMGQDDKHAYYYQINQTSTTYIVSDKKGTCEEWAPLIIDANGEETKTPFRYSFTFNGKLYVTYISFSKKNKENKVYASEMHPDGKLIPQTSIELGTYINSFDITNGYQIFTAKSTNKDSSELAVLFNKHVILFNSDFEKIKEADLDFSFMTGKNLYITKMIYDNDKLVILLDDSYDHLHSKHYKVWVYDFSTGKSKLIDIPTDKRIVIDLYKKLYYAIFMNSLSTENFYFKNGTIYLFGRVANEIGKVATTSEFVIGLVYINIDAESGECKIKYLSGTGNNAHYDTEFSTMGMRFNSDNSVIVYNNYAGLGSKMDSIEAIKFDKGMNVIWRKKISTVKPFGDSESYGFYFFNNQLVYLYIPNTEYKSGSKDLLTDLKRIEFDDETGNISEKTVYQFKSSEYKARFISLGLADDNNLFLEMDNGKDSKFLKIPF